jgi:starch synthase
MAKKTRVLFVTSEVMPLSKTGGMADVCDAIPKHLAENGYEVDVITPFYRDVKNLGLETTPLLERFTATVGGEEIAGSLLTAKIDRPWRPLLVVQDEFFDRDGLYTNPTTGQDHPDNAQRFAFFAKAVIAAIAGLKTKYDIVHANEWQGALALVHLRSHAAQDPLLAAPATVFTVHNVGYQGIFDAGMGSVFDLPPALFAAGGMEFFGKWNLLKGGLTQADFVTTVSEKYAEEIQTDEFGFGLQGVLRDRGDTLVGITHGVDYTEWNPETDRYIAAQYGPGKLAGKEKCKRNLLATFGISHDWEKKPIVGFIGRLVEQKGLDFIAPIAEDLLALGYTLIFLGSGEKKYEAILKDLQARFPEKIGVHIGFSEELAHKIEAGADLFLMPSAYEPCGLSQMYSQKYGTAPVVRATGGLDDTVVGWSKGRRGANGFKFADKNPEALLKVMADAAMLYDDKKRWTALIESAMATDHSWKNAIKKYERVYQKAIKARKQAAKAAAAPQ